MNFIKPMKTIASISTLCAVIAFSSVVSISNVNASNYDASFGSPQQYQKSKHMMKRMIKVLSLSEQQQVQIEAVKMQATEQSSTLRDSMKQFKGAEKLLLQAEAFDEQAYIALHEAYQQTFAQMALTRAKTKHAVFNILTTEQQEKWLQAMEKRKERFRKN